MRQTSQEIKERVIEARKAGSTYSEIAEKIGVSRSTANNICISAGIGNRVGRKKGKTCPKCKRGGFPAEFIFCPFCTADMRSEKELAIDRLERALELFPHPRDNKAAQVAFAILKTIEYLKNN